MILFLDPKVLNTCRFMSSSTMGVKTDIKRQTFTVANFPSVRLAPNYTATIMPFLILLPKLKAVKKLRRILIKLDI